MEIIRSKSFAKALKKLPPRLTYDVEDAVQKFQRDRLAPELHDHALKGRMKGLRAFSAGWDLRVFYREDGGFVTVLLLDVGTHNQVY